MHLTTSIIHGFCIANTFLQVIDFLQPFRFFETSASARAGHYLVAYGQLSRCPAFHPEPRSISRFWSFLRLQDGVLTMDGCADCMLPQNWYKSKEMFFFHPVTQIVRCNSRSFWKTVLDFLLPTTCFSKTCDAHDVNAGTLNSTWPCRKHSQRTGSPVVF